MSQNQRATVLLLAPALGTRKAAEIASVSIGSAYRLLRDSGVDLPDMRYQKGHACWPTLEAYEVLAKPQRHLRVVG